MITSITIKSTHNDIIYTVNKTGIPTLQGSRCIKVSNDTRSFKISAATDDLKETPMSIYLKKLSVSGLPYISKISGIKPDYKNNIWLIGDISSQITLDVVDKCLKVCDIGQTVNYPRIYAAVYYMLRQIRLWVDAHKDTILLADSAANTQWDVMRSDPDDWDPSTLKHLPVFKELRSRSEIQAIGDATNFFNQYLATVALWNLAAAKPTASSETRLHPEDSSGLYVGSNVIVPRSSNITTDIEITVTITRTSGQDDPDLYLWVRSPIAKVTPPVNGDSPVTVTLPSGDSPVSSTPSILDEGVQFKAPAMGSEIKVSFTLTIPESDMSHNMYTIQTVVELIPFILCGDDKTYAESRTSARGPAQGTNSWDIATVVYANGRELYSLNESKKTTYAGSCPEDTDEEEV